MKNPDRRTSSRNAAGCLRSIAIPLLALGLGGCIVQSIQPFYTESAKIAPPQIEGEWNLIRTGTDDLSTNQIKPWVFIPGGATNYNVETFNKENIGGKLKAVFFKAGDATFCDFLAGDLSDDARVNEFWYWNVRPIHTLSKATWKGDTLTLTPLNADWLSKAIDQKTVSLPFIQPANDDGLALFTATSEQWGSFLKAYAADTNAFPEATSYVLKKHLAAPKEKPGTNTAEKAPVPQK